MPGEMIINANDVPVTSRLGTSVGIPLQWDPTTGWTGYFGGFSFVFSASHEILTDSQGVAIGFSVHFDGNFTMHTGGMVQVGSGTMPPFDYVSGAGDVVWPHLLTIHAGPFGEFIENLDRVVFNGSDVANVFEATNLHANMVMNGGGGDDQLWGSNQRANDIYGGEGDDYIHGNSILDRLYGDAGNDYITDGDGTGLYTIYDPDFLYGGADNDILSTNGGNDRLDGGDGDDELRQSGFTISSDTFIGGLGNDTITGSEGFDTAIFSGNRAEYTITPFGPGVIVEGPDGRDTVYVERLLFDDGIVLLDGSNAPIITSDGGGDTAAISLPETSFSVTTVTATDGDPDDELTYSIVGGDDAAFFTIHGTAGFLGFAQEHDFENPADADHDNIYEVVVQVADALGNTDTQAISVTVTNVNDSAPVFASSSAVDFAENGVGIAYQASATDADNLGPLTYSLSGTDAALFDIDADDGAVTFKVSPDFEAPGDANADNIYEIVVTALDGTLAADRNVAITVTDTADANTLPTISIGDVTVTEGVDSSAVFTVTLSNASATPVSVQYFTSAGNQSVPGFASGGSDFTQIGGGLAFAPGETTKTISVPIVDDQSHEATEIFYVNLYNASGATIIGTGQAVGTILDNDVSPSITSLGGVDHAFIDLPENSTTVATVTATDPDSVGLTYSISGGFDQSFFAIDPVTGELTWKQAPDYERPLDPPYPGSPTAQDQLYDVQVRVADAAGNFDDQLITINVTNVNEAPTAVSLSNAVIAENSSSGTLIGILSASDPDAGDAASFTLLDDAGGRFSIVNGNQFVVNNGVALDYEQNTNHQVTVRVTDAAGATFEQVLAISVTNVDPDIVTGTIGHDVIYGGTLNDSLSGNFGNDTLVGGEGNDELQGQYDVDVLTGGAGVDRYWGSTSDWNGDRITDYEFGESIMVAFGSSSGQFYRLRQAAGDTFVDLDINQDGVFNGAGDSSIVLSGVINGFLSVSQSSNPIYAQLVVMPNTAPTITSDGGGAHVTLFRPENSSVVTTVVASDLDAGDTVTYSIASGSDGNPDGNLFTIDPSTGLLSFIAPPDFENPNLNGGNYDNYYAVKVVATDSSGATDEQVIEVGITNVNEPPTITSDGGGNTAAISVAENTAAVTNVTAADPDLGDTLTYSISGGFDGNLFTIDSQTGALSFAQAQDYENPDLNGGAFDRFYDVQVRATDSQGAFDEQLITVTLADVNEAPTATAVTLSAMAEDSGPRLIAQSDLLVGTSDEDGQSLSITALSIQSGNGTLVNNGDGTWSYTPAPNDDSAVTFNYSVSDGALTASSTASLDITPVNDAPVITTHTPNGLISEDYVPPSSGLTGSYSALQFVNYSTGYTDPDSGALHGIAIYAADAANGTWEYSLDYGVTWLPIGDVSIESALLLRGDFGATDFFRFVPNQQNGAQPTLSWYAWDQTEGSAGDRVSVVVTGGATAFSAASDTFTVDVFSVNDAPTLSVPGPQSTTTQVGLAIQDIVVSDPDKGDTLSVNLAVGAAGAYLTALGKSFGGQYGNVIGSGTPNVTVTGSLAEVNATLATLGYGPYDAAPGPDTIAITVTDTAGASTSGTVGVTILNTPPTITSNGGGDTAAISVSENTTAVTTVAATDPDAGTTLTYSIVGGFDGNLFTIDSQTGALSFAQAQDYENPDLNGGAFDRFYDVKVRATDSQGAFDEQLITVTLADLNEAPTITSSAAVSVAENTTAVTTVTANDPDAGTSVGYSISGGADADLFQIDAATGALSFKAARDYEAPADQDGDNIYEVVVQVSDGTLTDAQAIAVTLTDVDGVNINGTGGADTVSATQTVAGQPLPTNEEDIINGNGGGDILYGLGGDDLIDGGAGQDQMFGGTGNDTYVIDKASDVVDETGGNGIDLVRSSVAFDLSDPARVIGDVENLTLEGTGNIAGTGNALANVIIGNSGKNALSGLGAADLLFGGGGNDRFLFSLVTDSTLAAPDTIGDFVHGSDRIDVSAIDANTSKGGNQTFAFAGQNVNVVAHSITWLESGGNTIVRGDVNGDTSADFAVVLVGTNHSLAASDFVL